MLATNAQPHISQSTFAVHYSACAMQAEYDPTLYDAQYVNYVSLTGTVQNIYYNGNQCGFNMLLNKHTDPTAGLPPAFDA